MLLTRLLDTLRELGSQRLARDSGAEGSRRTDGSALDSAKNGTGEEFADLLDAIGAIDSDHGPGAQLALRDATIAELRSMLTSLRGIGDQLAWTEQERLRLVVRVAELEGRSKRPDPRVARSKSELARRLALLARERQRHAATRAKLAERKRTATERWNELLALRREIKRLRGLVD